MKVYIQIQETTDSNETFIQSVHTSKKGAVESIVDLINDGAEESHTVSLLEVEKEINESGVYECGYDLFKILERNVEDY